MMKRILTILSLILALAGCIPSGYQKADPV